MKWRLKRLTTVSHPHLFPLSTQWAESETYLPASAAIDGMAGGGRELLQVGKGARVHNRNDEKINRLALVVVMTG
jgi:hypothetical protein